MIIAFAVGLVLSAGQVYLDYIEEGGLLDQKVLKSLQVAEKAATRAVLILDSDLAQEVVSGLMQYDYVSAAAILDDHGSVLAGAKKDTSRLGTPSINYARIFVDDVKEYTFRLNLPDTMAERPGSLRVTVDRAIGLQPFFSRAVTTFLSGLVRNMLLVILLYFAFHQGLTKPLVQIVEKMSGINPEHPGEQRISVHRRHKKDELGLLVAQTNLSFDAVQVLLDNLRSTNKALSSSEEALRKRSWELEQEVERTKKTSMELIVTKEQAEAANRAKSVFLANVSHELRTPLNAIIGFSSIMADQMFGPIGHEKYREYLQDIRSSSEHLSDVLGEVLDLAKIEAGQFKMEDEDVDMVRLFNESQALISGQASQKGFSVAMDVPEDLPKVKGDRLRLKQSVLNLLSNAVKFTPQGNGNVMLSAAMDHESGEMIIRVADKGIGISPEEQELVFSPFVRSASALSRSHEGTGLGLSLVKAFVDMHGGTISLKSEPEKGSTFTIRLPSDRVITQA
ncbi:sensor histidine kinase [Kordiimonas marina]|uniref:sensor histidine kinase n=1 Tax=Kordiimonas marina TaxID=2872312 RepID=UPI001FF2C8E7|nr:HAMP domain-containing histidine kinase [Kordiimonas marina]